MTWGVRRGGNAGFCIQQPPLLWGCEEIGDEGKFVVDKRSWMATEEDLLESQVMVHSAQCEYA